MDLLIAWAIFPLVLGIIFGGCGLAVEAFVGSRLPSALLVPVGFAAVVVAGQVTTLGDATAELTVPLVIVIAMTGLGAAFKGRRAIRPPAALVVAVGALFAVYAAPMVASGETTLGGYIKLDDTATWLTFTDRIMEHGRDLSGLAESTYRRTLEVNVGEGYPIGAFIPFGVGVELLGVDAAWLIQPYMAFLAVIIALAGWSLVGRLTASGWTRGAIVFVGAQPALLYGYYLWGGVKELAAAGLIITVAALCAHALAHRDTWKPLIPLALACAALVGILSPGGLIWLLPILVGTLVVLARRLPAKVVALRSAGFALALAFMSLPVVIPGSIRPPTSSPLSDDAAQGNLIEPLDPLQVAGIWPVGDFRLPSEYENITLLLVGLVAAAAIFGVVWAFANGSLGVPGAALSGAIGCVALVVIGSPWVEGKSMATASAIVLLTAMVGALAVSRTLGRRIGVGVGVVIGGAVLWSNALAYQDVSLAPHDQFAELEEISKEIGGEGPTLMTEYSPYGARHFLRDAAPESVSELRYRLIRLRNGDEVEKGFSVDTDEIDPEALAVYRTLVLRRSPSQSRPPSNYELVWSGRYYEAWQRPAGPATIPARMPLGDSYDPIAEPRCNEVIEMAAAGSDLVAATGVSPLVVPLALADYPRDWSTPGQKSAPTPSGEGAISVSLRVNRPDVYEFWLGESLRPGVKLIVDGEPVGEVRHELNNYGQYVALGEAQLDPGVHSVEVRLGAPDLHPGSGGASYPIGPLVLSGTEAAQSRLERVDAGEANDLCGQEWDWIEAVR